MLELEHGFRVVDVHTRLDVDLDDTTIRGRAITPENLEREMHQAGIVRTIVFPGHYTNGYLKANNAVARYSVDRPFIPFARINGPRIPPGTPIDRLRNLTSSRTNKHVTPDDIERYAYDDRFHGFTIAPARDGLPDTQVLHELDDVGLPVLVRAGESFPPSVAEATFLQWSFPVIIAHFGGYPLNRELMIESINLLSEYDTCYLDTSIVRYRDIIERAMREHPDRILFGSGAPDVHPTVGITELLTLDVPEDTMKRAFSNNAERLFGDSFHLPWV